MQVKVYAFLSCFFLVYEMMFFLKDYQFSRFHSGLSKPQSFLNSGME